MLKIAILHGENPMDGKNMDGQVTFLSTDDISEAHIVTLIYFLKTHYLDDTNLQKLNYFHPIQTASYVFTRLGDIIFLDTTGANPRSNDGSGTFMMPDYITDAQKEALHQFKQYIINYTQRPGARVHGFPGHYTTPGRRLHSRADEKSMRTALEFSCAPFLDIRPELW